MMTETETKDENKSLQMFLGNFSATELTTPFSCPITITFRVELIGTVNNFIIKAVDVTWNQQLWAAAVNREMTDVEFLVG